MSNAQAGGCGQVRGKQAGMRKWAGVRKHKAGSAAQAGGCGQARGKHEGVRATGIATNATAHAHPALLSLPQRIHSCSGTCDWPMGFTTPMPCTGALTTARAPAIGPWASSCLCLTSAPSPSLAPCSAPCRPPCRLPCRCSLQSCYWAALPCLHLHT